MNYYGARQIDPASDRPEAGRWHYTCMNDGRVWPVGDCADGCGGHESPEDACQHYVEGQVAKGVRWSECSWTTCDNRPNCDKPARNVAYVGSASSMGYTLCNDHASDGVAEALYRLSHQGAFSSMASW